VSHLFRTKSIDALIAASEEPGKRLAKTLGPWSLTALGIGAVIGSGIFILTGTAARAKNSPTIRFCTRPCSICCCTGGPLFRPWAVPAPGPRFPYRFW
jgi:APA family basic amino acid/polyamine antiporter